VSSPLVGEIDGEELVVAVTSDESAATVGIEHEAMVVVAAGQG
jgi:hypothetical protein